MNDRKTPESWWYEGQPEEIDFHTSWAVKINLKSPTLRLLLSLFPLYSRDFSLESLSVHSCRIWLKCHKYLYCFALERRVTSYYFWLAGDPFRVYLHTKHLLSFLQMKRMKPLFYNIHDMIFNPISIKPFIFSKQNILCLNVFLFWYLMWL